jgi:hypothetical protein
MIYPDAIVKEEAKTSKNKSKSNKMFKAPFSGAKINMADRYCAKIIIGML